LLGVRFDFRNAIKHSALEIELHHDSQRLGKAGVHANWEIEGANGSVLDQPAKRRQRPAEPVVGIFLAVVTLFLWAENPLHFRIVIEERKEDGNAFDDRGSQLRLNSSPVSPCGR
jgi:hypothetical protein